MSPGSSLRFKYKNVILNSESQSQLKRLSERFHEPSKCLLGILNNVLLSENLKREFFSYFCTWRRIQRSRGETLTQDPATKSVLFYIPHDEYSVIEHSAEELGILNLSEYFRALISFLDSKNISSEEIKSLNSLVSKLKRNGYKIDKALLFESKYLVVFKK